MYKGYNFIYSFFTYSLFNIKSLMRNLTSQHNTTLVINIDINHLVKIENPKMNKKPTLKQVGFFMIDFDSSCQ